MEEVDKFLTLVLCMFCYVVGVTAGLMIQSGVKSFRCGLCCSSNDVHKKEINSFLPV